MPVRLEMHDAVAVIRLDAPQQRNALRIEDWRAFAGHLDLCRREQASAVVLSSAHPGIFCAGLDLDEVRASSAEAALAGELYDAMALAMDAFEGLRAMTLAAVDGAAVGAGCALAMACDMRVVAPRATFRTPPAHLGLIYPAADVRRLIRAAGYATTMWMLATGGGVAADRAVGIGMAVELSADPAAAALNTAARIADAVPGRLAAMKQAVAELAPLSDDTAQDRRRFVEALTAPETAARLRATRASRPRAIDPA